MSTLREALKAARDALAGGDPKEALKHCKAALKHDKGSYEAYIFAGKAAFKLEEYGQADMAYGKAVEINEDAPTAWMGRAELHAATGDSAALVAALEKLVALHPAGEGDAAALKKRADLLARLARGQGTLGRVGEAAASWALALAEGAEGAVRREALAGTVGSLLDEEEEAAQVLVDRRVAKAREKAEGGAEVDLEEIRRKVAEKRARDRSLPVEEALEAAVEGSMAWPAHARAHCAWVRRSLHRAAAARREESADAWAAATAEALAACLAMAARQPSDPLPLEAALDLVEDLEDLSRGGAAAAGPALAGACADSDVLTRRLAHLFPTSARGALACAHARWRRASAAYPPGGAARAAAARHAKAALARGLKSADGHAPSWRLLAEVQLELGAAATALECARRGLRAVRAARAAAGEALGPIIAAEADTGLRLAAAAALRETGKLEEAEALLTPLAGGGGGAAVAALRELGRVASRRGDPAAARVWYGRVLEASPGDPLAAGELAWLSYEEGDLAAARGGLEAAAVAAEAANLPSAELRARLGRVCWDLGGELREGKAHAHAHWLAAAGAEGPWQAGAFSWLGRWYREVAADPARARRCFQRALSLDPLQAEAGEALGDLLRAAGQRTLEEALYREMSGRASAAYWAHRRLARAEVAAGNLEGALASFQKALRGEPSRADLWESLADCYGRLGRITAALKSYGRAVELDASRVYSHTQGGALHAQLYEFHLAVPCFERALALDPAFPPALAGAAEALLTSARAHAAIGALGVAAAELARAEAHATKLGALRGEAVSAWKLLGDVQAAHWCVTPAGEGGGEGEEGGAAGAGVRALEARIAAVQRARRSYSRALHLCPSEAGHWGDLAAAHYHEAQLRRQHAGVAAARAALAPARAPALRAAAERLMRGGLRVDPSREELWLVLGLAAAGRAVQEYSLCRALELNNKYAPAWAVLGRLYAVHGEAELATKAFEQARSSDPTLAVTWEGMGVLAAQRGGESDGGWSALDDALGFFEHAVMLGAGAPSQLGLAECAIAFSGGDSIPPASGRVYAAARKSAAQQPLNAAAYNALGLASEARGLLGEAASAYATARELLDGSGGAGGEGVSEGEGDLLRFGPVRSRGGGGGGGGVLALREAVSRNLARALARGGRHADAELEFAALDAAGALEGDAASWHARGVALFALGDAAGAEAALHTALVGSGEGGGGGDAAARADVLAALCAVKCRAGRGREALQLLVTAPPDVLAAASSPGAAPEASRGVATGRASYHARGLPAQAAGAPGGVWGIVAAAAVARGDESLMNEVLIHIEDGAAGSPPPHDARAAALWLQAQACALRGSAEEAARLLARAARESPGLLPVRAALGRAVLAASPHKAQAVARMCLAHAAAAPPRRGGFAASSAASTDPAAELLRVAATAVLAGPPGTRAGRAAEMALAKWVHGDPGGAAARGLHALVATHEAAALPTARAYRRAGKLCEGAIRVVELSGGPAGGDPGERLRLLACLSECCLHSRRPGCGEAAMRWAEEAAREAAAAGDPPTMVAAARQQLARCHLAGGDVAKGLREYGAAAAMSGAAGANLLVENALTQCAVGQPAAALDTLEEAAMLASMPPPGVAVAGCAAGAAPAAASRVLAARAAAHAAAGDAAAAQAAALEAGSLPGLPAGPAAAALVIHGALCLAGADAGGEGDSAGQARRSLATARAQGGAGDGAPSPAVQLMLGAAERGGRSRGGAERGAGLVERAWARWEPRGAARPASAAEAMAEVAASGGGVAGGRAARAWLATAVHAEPWRPQLWSALRAA